MKGKIMTLVPLAAAASFTHAFSFSEGTFSDSEWTMIMFPGSSHGQMTEQILSGGNPGLYKRVSTINDSFTYNAHLRAAFNYTPSVSGAIASLNWSIDAKNFNTFGAGQGFALALMQGGTLYRCAIHNQTGLLTGWNTTSQTALASSHFLSGIGGSSHPDFSSTGSTITFGFMTSNGMGSTIDVGYDNYRVWMTPVPEPGSLAVLALGAVVLMRRRRRV